MPDDEPTNPELTTADDASGTAATDNPPLDPLDDAGADTTADHDDGPIENPGLESPDAVTAGSDIENPAM